jgi:hypothetical protein
MGALIQLGMRMVAACSFGKLTARHANLLYILEKAPGAAAVDPAVPAAASVNAGAPIQTPPTHAALLHR